MEGKLIVIDSFYSYPVIELDNQLEMLMHYFHNNKIDFDSIVFPRYHSFWGKKIEEFIKGDFGDQQKINPYFIQPYYLLDQLQKKEFIESNINAGKIVIVKRYVSSSKLYQAPKFKTKKEQEEFISWLQEAAYDTLKLPKPDLVIVLDKNNAKEKNELALKSADITRELVSKFENWTNIECYEDDNKISQEVIHKKILEKLKSFQILS